jgi:hypothetical protein
MLRLQCDLASAKMNLFFKNNLRLSEGMFWKEIYIKVKCLHNAYYSNIYVMYSGEVWQSISENRSELKCYATLTNDIPVCLLMWFSHHWYLKIPVIKNKKYLTQSHNDVDARFHSINVRNL